MSSYKSLKDSIFHEFLKNPNLGPSEMAEKLDANYNSVKATFSKLTSIGFIERLSRGKYKPNIEVILLDLISRVEELEERSYND